MRKQQVSQLVALAMAFAGLVTTTYAADALDAIEQYLCVAEKASGVRYNETAKEWTTVVFRADRKFIIAPEQLFYPYPEAQFHITEVGATSPMGWCDEGFSQRGVLHCTKMVGEFSFNRTTGRFLHVYDVGYYNVRPEDLNTPKENDNTPYVLIGKCSQF